MKEELEQRVQQVQLELRRRKLSGIVIEGRENSFYLSGFPSSASLLLITQSGAWFFTDSRYYDSAVSSIKHMEVMLSTQRAFTQIADLARKKRLKRIGFEETAAYAQVEGMKKAFDWAELSPAGSIVSELRLVKSDREIKTIAANQRLNQKIYNQALEYCRPGMTEVEIRNQILRHLIDHGAEEAFASIVATGANSANPHAIAGNLRLKPEDLLLFDMGVKKNYYHSDMTRTVAVGEKLKPECARIYEVVLAAQLAAVKELGPGVPCKHVDSVARDIISKAGYGDYFGHGLGHGVGLHIHEGPTLNPRSNDILQSGMVVTVEPGIYLPGIGGVRIEDLLVITENGAKNLTSVPKRLTNIAA